MAVAIRNVGTALAGIIARSVVDIAREDAHRMAAVIIRETRQLARQGTIQAGELANQITHAIIQHARETGHAVVNAANRLHEGVLEIANELANGNNNEWAIEFDGDMNDLLDEANRGAIELWRNQQRDSLSNSQPTTLDEIMPEQAQGNNGNEETPTNNQLSRATNSTTGNGISKETPISIYPTLTYGLQETHTTILPYTAWVSYAFTSKLSPLQLILRMNGLHDIIPITVTNIAGGTGATSPGFYNRPLTSSASVLAGSNTPTFPQTLAGGTTTTERPQWRDYWNQIYEYYTILGCEWKITITNEQQNRNADVVVGQLYESYSDAASATGNIMPTGCNLAEAMAFKGMKWTRIAAPIGTDDQMEPNQQVIKGYYKPGMIKRNIVNDGDVKTWTKTDGSFPNLKEFCTFNIWQSALNPMNGNNANSGCGNIQIEVKYIVQYKDLKQIARYPSASILTSITQQIGTNNAVVPSIPDQVLYLQ